MDTVHVGFIGCGGIANWHLQHFEKMDDAKVVAVCDLIEERVNKAAERMDARPYLRCQDMLEKEELDAVYVCVEPSAHDGMEFMIIDKGCHLFVQKPMTLDMHYANRVKEGLAAKGLLSCVGFQCRYMDTWPRLKAWLDMQEVAFFSGYRVHGMPAVWWWRQKEHSGGQIIEQTIHNYDICRLLFGDVVSVEGMARSGIVQGVENYDVDDCSAVTMRYESGVIGTMFTGCFTGFGGESTYQAFCREAKAEFGFGGFKVREPNMTIEAKVGNDYGQEIDDTFMDAIRTGDGSEILSPYEDACKTLKMTLAAQASIDAGGKLIELGSWQG